MTWGEEGRGRGTGLCEQEPGAQGSPGSWVLVGSLASGHLRALPEDRVSTGQDPGRQHPCELVVPLQSSCACLRPPLEGCKAMPL